MKIASWNVNSLNVRLPHLERWVGEFVPDVVGLQETKLDDARFPAEVLDGLGYRNVFHGQKTYNGVAILARGRDIGDVQMRSEEHTSELQSRPHLVCRLLLEKNK